MVRNTYLNHASYYFGMENSGHFGRYGTILKNLIQRPMVVFYKGMTTYVLQCKNNGGLKCTGDLGHCNGGSRKAMKREAIVDFMQCKP